MVFELEGDLREAKLGDRAHLFDVGQAGEFELERLGDEFLGFLGGEGGDLGIDLDLNACDVGHGIHREMQRGPKADGEKQGGAEEDDRALAQGELEDAIDHGAEAAGATVTALKSRPVSWRSLRPAARASAWVSSKASMASR